MIERINEELGRMTIELFRAMFGCDIIPAESVDIDPEKDDRWDVSGVVSITGSLSGLIAMRYPQNVATFLLGKSRLLNTENQPRLLDDMIGEVTNILVGNLLSGAVYDDLYLSVPIAVKGPGHLISWPKNTPIRSTAFSIGRESFVVQLGLK